MQIAMLYDGKVRLTFNAQKHSYIAEDLERGQTFYPRSVTQVVGILDKPALVYWAANATCDYLRTKILPGQSYDEIELGEMFNEARYNFRRISKTAVSVGALVHTWIEEVLKRKINLNPQAPELPINPQARNACEAAMQWMTQHHYEPLAPEQKLYSRKHNVAGTMDWPAMVDGELAIVDWKTTKRADTPTGLYDEMILQIDTYATIYEEMTGKRVKQAWVVRIDKETAQPEAVCLDIERKKAGLNPRGERRANFKAFLGLKAASERMLILKNGGKATTDLGPALVKSIKKARKQDLQVQAKEFVLEAQGERA
jgi:hypothetical protein